ncbi:MAG: tetratricopeptide repeat protein [bacterium]
MKVSKLIITLALIVFVSSGILFATASDDAKQYLDYGNKLLKAKQIDKAISYFNQSIKLSPSSENYYSLGVAQYYKADQASALRSFQYSLKLNPANAAAKAMVAKLSGGAGSAAAGPAQQYLMTGHKYLKAKQYDMAIKYYQASAKVGPTYQAYQFMGTAFYYKGDFENAKLAYNKSLQLNPNNPGVKNVLAKLNSSTGGAAEPRISQQLGVHPILLAGLFAAAIAVLFLF